MVVAFVAFDGAGFAGQPVNSKADTMTTITTVLEYAPDIKARKHVFPLQQSLIKPPFPELIFPSLILTHSSEHILNSTDTIYTDR